MHEVEFPPDEYLDAVAGLIEFPAVLEDGRSVPCAVGIEALQESLRTGYGDPMPAFHANRPLVEAAAARLIAQGRFEPNGGILVGAGDL